MDTVLLVACCVMALLATVLPVNLREAIAGGLRRTVVAPLVSLQQQAERGRSAFLSREATTSRLDSVSLRNMQLARLAEENARLRALLGLGRELQWGFVSAEALRVQSIGEDNTLTLTVGARAGVEPKTPVVAPEGLVGMVRTVDPTSSIAIMWTHSDFAASAMSADRSAYGIRSELQWGFVSAEALRVQSIGEDNTLTLTVGARAGVEPKTPVVAPEGLVGMVRTVDPTSSIAIMWTHSDFAASAMSADRSAYGI